MRVDFSGPPGETGDRGKIGSLGGGILGGWGYSMVAICLYPERILMGAGIKTILFREGGGGCRGRRSLAPSAKFLENLFPV